MQQRFLRLIRSFQPDLHVAGHEANVQAKIATPLVEALGWDLLDEVWFEQDGVDVILGPRRNGLIIIEIKSDIANFSREQVLRYSRKMRIPWIVVLTATELYIYHALGLLPSSANKEPLLRLRIVDLADEANFDKVASLIDRNAIVLDDAKNLMQQTERHLRVSRTEIDQWHSTLDGIAHLLELGTSRTRDMWIAMQPYMSCLEAFVEENPDVEMGTEGVDDFVLRAKNRSARAKIRNFGKELEAKTGGRGKKFHKTLRKDNTLKMEVAH